MKEVVPGDMENMLKCKCERNKERSREERTLCTVSTEQIPGADHPEDIN